MSVKQLLQVALDVAVGDKAHRHGYLLVSEPVMIRAIGASCRTSAKEGSDLWIE
jgi:hypothetical protein